MLTSGGNIHAIVLSSSGDLRLISTQAFGKNEESATPATARTPTHVMLNSDLAHNCFSLADSFVTLAKLFHPQVPQVRSQEVHRQCGCTGMSTCSCAPEVW